MSGRLKRIPGLDQLRITGRLLDDPVMARLRSVVRRIGSTDEGLAGIAVANPVERVMAIEPSGTLKVSCLIER